MKIGLREAILEFNKGAQYYNKQRFDEAIPIFRQSTVLFRRFRNQELILYSYELLAKSYEINRQYEEANKCWIFLVIYSLQNNVTKKLSYYIERFCKLKYRFSLKFKRRYSALSTIINDVIKIPLSCLCEEIGWYQKMKMKEDEEEVINIIIERSKEEKDEFYLGEGYLLLGLLEEKKIRIKTEGIDIVDYVLNSFIISDEKIVQVYKYLKMGVDLVKENEEIDDALEDHLFSASIFYFHQGKYRSQIDILNMIRGTPNLAKRMKYNCYMARTLISIGSVKDAENYLGENQKIMAETHQSFEEEEEEEDDIFEISSSPKVRKDQQRYSGNSREWLNSKLFFALTQGLYHLELNQHNKSKEKLDLAGRIIETEKKNLRRVSSSLLSPVERNDDLKELEALNRLQIYYRLLLSLRHSDLTTSINLSHDLLESQKTGSSQLPLYIPHHCLFMAVGDVYEQLGFLSKANFYYYKGIQSGIYTRTRLGVANFLLRLARLEKNRLRFDTAEKHFHVLTCLFDGDNIDESLLEDELDQLGISYLTFLFERSDFYFKVNQYPNCQDYFSYAMKTMAECHMWSRANSCEVVDLCTRAKEFESQILNFDGGVMKARECLEMILRSPVVPPVSHARILYRLQQSYLGKRYLFDDDDGRDDDDFFGGNGGNNRRQRQNLNFQLEKVAPSSIPTITKPTYSVLGCTNYHLGELTKSFYYSNMSMGIRLRHEKLDLLRRKMDERKKNHKKVSSQMQKIASSLSFDKASSDVLKDIIKELPSDIEVFSFCLSHDSSSIIVTHLTSKGVVSTREVPLIYKRRSFKKYRKKNGKKSSSNKFSRPNRLNRRRKRNEEGVNQETARFIKYLRKYERQYKTSKEKHWYLLEHLARRSHRHLSVDDENGMNQIIADPPNEMKDEDEEENAFTSSYTSSSSANEEEEEEDQKEEKIRKKKKGSTLTKKEGGEQHGNIIQEEESTLFFAICELEDILKESNLSLHETEFVKSSFQRKRWWKTRHELNNRMKDLIDFLQLAIWSPPRSALKFTVRPGPPEVSRPSPGSHVVIVLDKVLHQFPWEMMPVFSGNSVSRVPSLMLLYSQLLQTRKEKPRVDPMKTMYIVNPDTTLKKTEKKFRQEFSPFLRNGNWKGWVGVSPTSGEFLKTIRESDIFIYMGHGGGEEFIHSQDIVELRNSCKVAFLMGCSSGQLTEHGLYEPTGTPLKYLLSGCLCVVANLWEVTDKDCDRLSHWMIKEWLEGKEGRNVAQLLPKAREKCLLKYLIGGAAIVYGLPL